MDDDDALDVCECGDYRKGHVLSRGECRVCNALGHPLAAYYSPCRRFRLSLRSDNGASDGGESRGLLIEFRKRS